MAASLPQQQEELTDPTLTMGSRTLEEYHKLREELYIRKESEQKKHFFKVKTAPFHVESHAFPENKFVWNDMDPRFTYTLKDVPPLDVYGRIRIRVTTYKAIDDIRGKLMGKEVANFRNTMNKELNDYCSTSKSDPSYWPKNEEIIFVHVPPSVMSANPLHDMKLLPELSEKQQRWCSGWLLEDGDDDDEEKTPSLVDHVWMRAEFRFYNSRTDESTFYLIDTGETVRFVATRELLRKPVLRIVAWPALSISVMIALHNIVQYTPPLTEKWSKLIIKGMTLQLALCGYCNEKYMTRLEIPAEDELEFEYVSKQLHKGKDVTNDPIESPAKVAYMKHVVTLGSFVVESPKQPDEDYLN